MSEQPNLAERSGSASPPARPAVPASDPIAALIAKKLHSRIAERRATTPPSDSPLPPKLTGVTPSEPSLGSPTPASPPESQPQAPPPTPPAAASPAAASPAAASPPRLPPGLSRGQRRMARARLSAPRKSPDSPAAQPESTSSAPPQPSPHRTVPQGHLGAHRRYRSWKRAPGESFQRSPAFAVAGFLHVLLLVGLSFWTIASHLEQEVLPVEVRIAKPQKVVPITAGTDQTRDAALEALQDSTRRDLEALSEADTDDPFHEARGEASGEVNVFGVGGGGRAGVGRGGKRNKRGGASKASEGALTGGLEWLARHQASDGSWGVIADTHQDPERKRPKGGDIARTGLAVLCYLCADHDPTKAGPYQGVVKRGLEWLVKRTSRLGVLSKGRRNGHYSYEHPIATLALAEGSSRWKDADLRAATQRAVSYILRGQTALGWRYGMGASDTDTSVTSWMVLALRSAEHAGIEVPAESYGKVRDYLKLVSGKDGTTAYMPGASRSPAMNASGLFLRIMLGESPLTKLNQRATSLVSQTQIQIQEGGVANFYHLYYAALAMYQVGGKPWKVFNPRIRDGLVGTQHRGQGCKRGSWRGAGYINDRVLSTCFATLTLETYYRYLPVHQGADLELEVETISEGERLLDLASAAMHHARTSKASGEVLAAAVAYERSLRKLREEKADWASQQVALLALVELGQLGADPDAALSAVANYLGALPKGETPDPRVLRVQRLQRYAILQARVLPVLTSKDTSPKQALIEEVDALEASLQAELPQIPAGEDLREAQELLGQVQEWQLRLVFSQDPAAAIAKAQAQIKGQPADGRPSEAERRLFLATHLHAAALFTKATQAGDPQAIAAGESALAVVEQRRIYLRLPGEERKRLEPMVQRSQVGLLAALLKHRRYQRAAREARTFQIRHPECPLLDQAEAIERGALGALARRGPLPPLQRRRLQGLLRSYVARTPQLPVGERLALAQLFEAAGDLELAAQQLKALKTCPKRTPRVLAHLGLARIARLEGRPQMGLDELDDLGGAEQDRLDVVLERCLLQRAMAEPTKALNRYLELLRFLDSPEVQAEWWLIAHETALTYLETKQPGEAARFLEGLRRRDRSFGGDPARKLRFRDLMRKVDLLRSR